VTPTAALEGLIDRLHQRGRLRVWSLVITIFGDAIVPRGGQVPLSVLQEIMARLRIEPGALRTALSRLAADQWVTREKDGRNSFYALDEHGRHAFDLATRRIYADGPPSWDGTWTVAIAPPGGNGRSRAGELHEAGFVEAGSGTWLRPETDRAPEAGEEIEDMLVFRHAPMTTPKTIDRFWGLDETADAYKSFAKAMTPLGSALESAALPPLESVAARMLLIHDWRRVVLHDPGLPEALLPKDWPGEQARTLERKIYAKLAAPSEHWLDRSGLPPLTDPATFASRFGG
jgi:phenylacetic acid degradation operon negative regulatory protein